jgi:hypothetical protein
MRPDKNLFQIDYLVFSSFKSATQTVTRSLRFNNIPALHCHSLNNRNINLRPGSLASYLDMYHARRNQRLPILTIFREPIQRYISAFFQWHGKGVIRKITKKEAEESIIYQKSIGELQEQFLNEVCNLMLVGQRESIDDLCVELGIRITDLNFNLEQDFGLLELPTCRLFTLRFDRLFPDQQFEALMSEITGRPIAIYRWNISSAKWYSDRYAQFNESLIIPEETIRAIYHSKRELLDLFYPGQFEAMLSTAIAKYHSKRSVGTSPIDGPSQITETPQLPNATRRGKTFEVNGELEQGNHAIAMGRFILKKKWRASPGHAITSILTLILSWINNIVLVLVIESSQS